MDHQQTNTIYTCPMHLEIKQNEPGNCPKYGMNLVPLQAKTDKSISHKQKGYRN